MITFPPEVLTREPLRLPVLARTEEWFAVAKPAGLAVAADPLEPEAPDLQHALAAALAGGKRQLAEHGITGVERVHGLDVAATGAVVYAQSAKTAARLRNGFGSGQGEFVFDLLVGGALEPRSKALVCDLPLVRHDRELRMLVSHGAGKRSATTFTPVRGWDRYSLWEARTRENRPHQIRVHAAESGRRIPGEQLYDRVRLVYLSSLKRGYRPGRAEERPLHGPLCLHLREVHLREADGSTRVITAPRPRSFEALLRRLDQHGRPPALRSVNPSSAPA